VPSTLPSALPMLQCTGAWQACTLSRGSAHLPLQDARIGRRSHMMLVSRTWQQAPSIAEPAAKSSFTKCGAAMFVLGAHKHFRRRRTSTRRKRGVDGNSLTAAAESTRDGPQVPSLLQTSKLLRLTAKEKESLLAGECVRKQERKGRTGHGLFVVEVAAARSVVLNCLQDFEHYPETIPVVRDVNVDSDTTAPNGVRTARCTYRISKFWLSITVMQTVDAQAGIVRFDLAPCGGRCLLKDVMGLWLVEPIPGSPCRCRVWMSSTLVASSLLPSWLVDYAAERALRRATAWLKPCVEKLAQQLPPTPENKEDTVATMNDRVLLAM